MRALDEVLAAGSRFGARVEKDVVADGGALVMPEAHWVAVLAACREGFPRLRRKSCSAMVRNVIEKGEESLTRLREAGLAMFYLGPGSGDDVTFTMALARAATSGPRAGSSAHPRTSSASSGDASALTTSVKICHASSFEGSARSAHTAY